MATKKQPITLVMWGDGMDLRQREFERRAVHIMNLNAGAFAINCEQNRYINRYIQWLWTQFQKGEARG